MDELHKQIEEKTKKKKKADNEITIFCEFGEGNRIYERWLMGCVRNSRERN